MFIVRAWGVLLWKLEDEFVGRMRRGILGDKIMISGDIKATMTSSGVYY